MDQPFSIMGDDGERVTVECLQQACQLCEGTFKGSELKRCKQTLC